MKPGSTTKEVREPTLMAMNAIHERQLAPISVEKLRLIFLPLIFLPQAFRCDMSEDAAPPPRGFRCRCGSALNFRLSDERF